MTGEQILLKARDIVGPPPYFRREDWEDQIGAVVVALCDRRRRVTPEQALRAERIAQRRWAAMGWLPDVVTGEGLEHDGD